jgi:fatty acid-binding protein DegV
MLFENYDYIISTDSGCDLSKDVCESKGIVPLLMKYLDGENVVVDTMVKTDIVKFYGAMEKEGKMFKTRAVNIQEGYEFLSELIKHNKTILHIALGSGISSTYQNMINAQ